jgi:hypothetical protein
LHTNGSRLCGEAADGPFVFGFVSFLDFVASANLHASPPTSTVSPGVDANINHAAGEPPRPSASATLVRVTIRARTRVHADDDAPESQLDRVAPPAQ